MKKGKPYLLLKWGTLKGWGNLTEKQITALQKFADLGMSMSAATQEMTDAHKKALCDAIELFEDGHLQNDWDGKVYTVTQAKKYIMGYSSGKTN